MRTIKEVKAKIEQLEATIEENKPMAFSNTMAQLSIQALKWVLEEKASIFGEEPRG